MMSLISIVLVGMRSLAVQLSDPFGDDLVDFEIEDFLKSAFMNAVAHLREPRQKLWLDDMPSDLRSPLHVP